jgi:hypothetical protein
LGFFEEAREKLLAKSRELRNSATSNDENSRTSGRALDTESLHARIQG